MQIKPIMPNLYDKLEIFCNKCEQLQYNNNSSFKRMKLEWCKSVGEFWCAIKNDEIIAVAGCHPFPEISTNAWRILFRGCELPKKDNFKGLGKGNWNSITQREFVPIMIEWCPSDQLFITTNIYNEHSNGKAQRNHKIMKLLARQKILTHYSNIMLNNCFQSVWQLNINEYLSRRNKLKGKYVD